LDRMVFRDGMRRGAPVDIRGCRVAARSALFCALLASCLLCGSSSAWAQPATRAPVQGSTASIVEAVRNRRFDEALQQSSVAIKKAPNDYRLWALRGMAFAGAEQPQSALAAYEHALKLAPNYLPALEGAAQIEYHQGSDRARPLLLHILALRPADPTTHAMLATLDYKAKRCDEAVPHFQQAGSLVDSQPSLLNEFALCLLTLNRYEDAIPVLRRLLAFDLRQQSGSYNLALAQWNAGHTQDAIATLGPLVEANPGDEDVLNLAADVYESNGDTPRAVQLLRQAILANPKKVAAYLQFSTVSYNHGSIPAGIEMLNTGLTQLPNEPRLYLARAVLESEKGDFTSAMEDFATVDRLDPNLSIAGVAEGLADSEQHKSAKALASFRAAVKAHPDDAFAHYLLAEALSEDQSEPGTSEYAEAVANVRRAVVLNPKMSDALNLLSTLALRGGDAPHAIEYSQKALAIDANDQQALYHLMLALRKTGRKDEVPAVLKRLIAARKSQSAVQKKRYRIEVQPQPTSVDGP
jgi:tetratricopeptide (TPR) repeat protein